MDSISNVKSHLLLFVLLLLSGSAAISQKQITLSDIYEKGTFVQKNYPPVFATPSQSREQMHIIDPATNKELNNISAIIPSPKKDGWTIVKTDEEAIYRHSTKSLVYLYNNTTKKLIRLTNEKALHPEFSPNGNQVAYVMNNNLYIYDIPSSETTQITRDGKWNYIINGNCDWVYEEEFSFTKAFQWSPQGNYIAYYRFDESNVKEYSFTQFDNHYNNQYTYKYPKAGEDNSRIEIHLYDINNAKDTKAQFEEGDIYIPRIKWTSFDDQLVIFWMNRHQNNLKLLLTNAVTGQCRTVYEETNPYYIDITDDWHFLKDGRRFIFSSEMNGYKNLYLYSFDGATKTSLTRHSFDIDEVCGIDEAHELIYYTAAQPTPMDRNLFVASFSGKVITQLTNDEGYHSIVMNKDCSSFYDYYSTINTPTKVSLHQLSIANSKPFADRGTTISDNAELYARLKEFNIGKASFIRFKNDAGVYINGWMLKPAFFDSTKKYPVLFCNYGGPGSQQVLNRFGAVSMWHQLLAQKGFIIVSFDNTGTGFRGEAFKKKTYLQLGKYEIEDQINAARWLATLPYIDPQHIGHWGWSFGGFMSSLAITKGADVFSAAIAVAPVTNWRFYDNIYTERYMRTPQENPTGYDKNSPIHFTHLVKGKYLIIHGTADDNVHFQNATQMVTALVQNNIPFESFYYPNKNHGISGQKDHTTLHLWTKMTNWILQNLGNENTDKAILP